MDAAQDGVAADEAAVTKAAMSVAANADPAASALLQRQQAAADEQRALIWQAPPV